MKKPVLPPDVERALGELASYARERFGARLERLVLFGSYARGEAVPLESDVDVLLAVRELTAAEMEEIVRRAAEITSRHNVLLTPVAIDAARFRGMEETERLLATEIARDGVPL
ncbi:MAG: nucleotidyltransferase domain-containing protein [Myxococcales bacterium]|nr:nucleotidyltransferase domain-containing protein [Myxococcales bacterium]